MIPERNLGLWYEEIDLLLTNHNSYSDVIKPLVVLIKKFGIFQQTILRVYYI